MSNKHRIRGKLPANREQQPRHRQRLRMEPFGLYRPVLPESKRALKDALYGAEDTLNDRVAWWKEGTRFRLSDHLGATVLELATVSDAMKAGSIERSFSTNQFIRRLEAEYGLQQEIEVSLADIGWYGRNESKMAVQLANMPELYELELQSERLQVVLDETNAEISDINYPNHITLFSFGNRKDQETRARVLNDKQRSIAAGIVSERLAIANLGSVCLGPVVIGRGYAGAQSIETLVS